jgi:hypothetical protein
VKTRADIKVASLSYLIEKVEWLPSWLKVKSCLYKIKYNVTILIKLFKQNGTNHYKICFALNNYVNMLVHFIKTMNSHINVERIGHNLNIFEEIT